MTEERLNELRQTDANLRDALKMDVAERPQMPADLNERLMQRVAIEKKKPRRIIWPWIAAACVAGVLMIWLTPPKTDTLTDVVADNKPAVVEQPAIHNKVEEPQLAKVETEAKEPVSAPTKAKKARKQQPKTAETEALHPEVVPAVIDEPMQQLAQATTPKVKMQTLTEHDIPINRPENYQYTPEELALMKKQANEAYLKWVELELEIAKHNLEQTAQY